MFLNKISSWQLVFLLYLSRIFTALMYVPSAGGISSSNIIFFGMMFSVVIQGIILIPAIYVFKKTKTKDILTCSYKVLNNAGGILVSTIFFIFMMFITLIFLLEFNIFMSNEIFSNAKIISFIIPIMTVSVYIANNKIQGLARMSSIIFIAFIISFLFIVIGSLDKIELLNIKPSIDSSISDFFTIALDGIGKNMELVALLLMIPYLNTNPKKTIFRYLILVLVIVEILAFLNMSVLGDFAGKQLFPFYSVATISQISIFQRLDALHMAIWVTLSVIKISLYLFLSNKCLCNIIPKKYDKIGLLISGIIITILGLFLGNNVKILTSLYKIISSGALVIIPVLILPTILLIIYQIKKGVRKDENKNIDIININCDY